MEIVEIHIEDWFLQCLPDDGGRISILRYAGRDLLTSCPAAFRPPVKNTGEYETRPVYGYDDCFPSVDPCEFPGQSRIIRDHGDLCWKKWQITREGSSVICRTDISRPEGTFMRTLEFSGNILKWKFKVINRSSSGYAFLHVMHALMPLSELQFIIFSRFDHLLNETTSATLHIRRSDDLFSYLQGIEPGSCRMLILQKPEKGIVQIGLKSNLVISIEYNADIFPSLGIWWNNGGYPDEDGLRRNEFAFEPIPGSCSSLGQSYKDGLYLKSFPGKAFDWEITWKIETMNNN